MKKRYEKPLTAKELAELPDKDIDYSDIAELDDDFWKNAKLVEPEKKKQLTVRFDAEVVQWFKAQGKGYLTRMNAVLKSYYEAHKHDG